MAVVVWIYLKRETGKERANPPANNEEKKEYTLTSTERQKTSGKERERTNDPPTNNDVKGI